jgi:hypothetical protein
MTLKTAKLRIPRPSGIVILNVTILVVLALLVSHKVSQDHKSEMDSARRASHRWVQAVAAQRDGLQDQRLVSHGWALRDVPRGHAPSMAGCPGRFE